MNIRRVSSIAILGGVPFWKAAWPVPAGYPPSTPLKSSNYITLKAYVVSYLGRAAVRIANTEAQDSGYGEGLAIVRGTSLWDGTIEVTLSGDSEPDGPPQLRFSSGLHSASRIVHISSASTFVLASTCKVMRLVDPALKRSFLFKPSSR